MLKTNRVIHNDAFCDYCYRMFIQASDDQRMNLNHEERILFASTKDLREFVKKASKQTLDYLLTKIGIEWVQIYGPSKDEMANTMFNAVDIYEFPHKRKDLADRMYEKNMYATGSRETMTTMHLVAQATNSEYYKQTARAREIAESVKAIKQNKPYFDVMGRSVEAYDYLNNLMLLQFESINWMKDMLNVDYPEFLTLSVLFKNRDKAFRLKELTDELRVVGVTQTIRKMLQGLIERGMIMSDIQSVEDGEKRHPYYMITTLGIEKVIKYRTYIQELITNKLNKK